MKTVIFCTAALLVICTAGMAQNASQNQRSRTRGKTPTQDPNVTLDRGRIGSEASVPANPTTWHGVLVDAGCNDRSAANLGRAPVTTLATEGQGQSASQSSAKPEKKGAASREAESSRTSGPAIIPNAYEEKLKPLWAHTPDHITRQSDPACGVTAMTKAFALYLPDGSLLNLDEGGNTLALAALQGTERGQALMEGRAGTLKPAAKVVARRDGDKLIVAEVQFENPKSGKLGMGWGQPSQTPPVQQLANEKDKNKSGK